MRISDWSSDVCSSDLQPQAEVVYDAGDRRHDHHGRSDRLAALKVAPANVDQDTAREDQQHDARSDRSACLPRLARSEEHTSELQSLMRISYAVFCLKKKSKTRLMVRTICQYDKT